MLDLDSSSLFNVKIFDIASSMVMVSGRPCFLPPKGSILLNSCAKLFSYRLYFINFNANFFDVTNFLF